MSFTILITGVPDKDLGPLIARLNLPRGAKHEIKHQPDHVALLEGPKRRRMAATTHLTMTGKVPQKGSQLEIALEAFEKLEKKQGIGAVTMADLQQDLKRRKLHEKVADRLRKAGFVAYLD